MAQSNVPRPEHPRPDQQRAEWLNLNGQWEFFESDVDAADPRQAGFPDEIIVPFCRESRLSGLGRTGFINNVWYRRTFDATEFRAPRQRLHIMAADYRTRVWLNGTLLGTHIGGNTPISYEVTGLLKPTGNEVVVHCYDNPRSGLQPLGKQSRAEQSQGIFYTRTTGIWQTVWLEGVGNAYIGDAYYVAKADGQFDLVANVEHLRPGLTLECQIETDDPVRFSAPATATQARIRGRVSDITPWSVETPQLYRAVVRLIEDGVEVDRYSTYIGFRTVEIRGTQILLNGRPVFQRLVLDQGFYPEGIWTAPSDEDLRNDIVLAQQAGFNGARLHQKVFEPRFLYHAATLGYLCWGEFPNYGPDHEKTEIERPWINEWIECVKRDRSQPAIIGWCPFNETDPRAIPLQGTIVRATRLMDDTRPCIETSGWSHGMADPAILDAHDYDQNPVTFRNRWLRHNGSDSALPARYQQTDARIRPFMVSEYGGIGWATGTGWGYGNPPQSEDEFFSRLKGLTQALLDNPNHFGFVYTQLTDVEQERNGVYTYDRQPKFAMEKFAEIFGAPAAYETAESATPAPERDYVVFLGAHPDGERSARWRMSLNAPEGWMKAGFNDTDWAQARGGFGRKDGWDEHTVTPWTGPDIYLRTTAAMPADYAVGTAQLVIHYDNATEVYLNGELLWQSDRGAWNDRYEAIDVTARFRELVRVGPNTVAVHCHQDTGGQFLDLAILIGQ
ncbi:MAG: hypothetical protein KF812_08205 [Fimbriimonadaceae bacterium]|nr:hypothetical protein [Fimbriimonadaceae bacterium]